MIGTIAESVAAKLSLEDWEWHVILPPMGYDMVATKCILQLQSGKSTNKFLVKLSNSNKLNDYLDKEASSLMSLHGFGVQRIPEVILNGTLDGRSFLVERFMEGTRVHSARKWFETVFTSTRGWLAELYSKAGVSEVSAEELIRRTEQNVETSKEFFDVEDSVGMMVSSKPQRQVPATWIHGDFWHGNMINDSSGQFWFMDFSMSSKEEPPVDVLDLILDYEPNLLISEEGLAPYVSQFIPAGIPPIFLILYNLNRKVALKVRARKRLREEMLLLDINQDMSRIEEAGMLRRIIMNRAARSTQAPTAE